MSCKNDDMRHYRKFMLSGRINAEQISRIKPRQQETDREGIGIKRRRRKMIEIKNLVKRYGSLVALDHLNLHIKEGEIFGLLGPNGSGKTTAINCMLALLKYDRGSIRIMGEEMQPDSYRIKQEIGVVMQDVAVFDELSVHDNIDCFCSLYVKDKKRR